jgi:hypothetical protein
MVDRNDTEFEFVSTRRRFLKGLLAFTGGAAVGWRFSAYPISHAWVRQEPPLRTKVFHLSECVTLRAVIEAVGAESDPSVLRGCLMRCDELVSTFSRKERLELGGALFLLEQMGGGFGCRFSALSVEKRQDVLSRFREARGLRREIYVGMKELSALALYTGDSRWAEMDYRGPLVPRTPSSVDSARAFSMKAGFLGQYWSNEESV